MPVYEIKRPKKYLVRGLRIYHDRYEQGLSIKGPDVIEALDQKGLWIGTKPVKQSKMFDAADEEYEKKQMYRSKSSAVCYHRQYISMWLEEGWICKEPEYGKRYILTEKGRNVINTFYRDDD